ncbi:LLM class flavin-dependent oxidoreductase [Arthrobacter alpinus]|nr:LLM class flavin-dependent oxidoreductase [Arthrobacter alpinus]
MPASSPGAMLAAAAGATKNIKLGSAASIISTDDPVRVYQQMTTADAISGGGRIEITAGRGSSVETFPLFGFDLRDYDQLYSEKLDLLMAINNAETENVTWSGSVRPAIDNLAVVPRPVKGSCRCGSQLAAARCRPPGQDSWDCPSPTGSLAVRRTDLLPWPSCTGNQPRKPGTLVLRSRFPWLHWAWWHPPKRGAGALLPWLAQPQCGDGTVARLAGTGQKCLPGSG